MGDWSTWAWVVAGIVLPCWALGAYNRLVALRGALVAAWAQIDETVRRRDTVLAALLQRLRAPLAEHDALDTCVGVLAQVRGSAAAVGPRPFSAGALSVFWAYELDLHEACAHLRELIDHAPRPPDAPALAAELSPALAELERLDEKLHAARQWFERQALLHDQALLQFPTRLLRPWFGFAPVGRPDA
jgi:LemA protein